MVTSGIWEGKPFADQGLARKFQKEFDQFANDKSFMVKDDKVAVALNLADSTLKIATKNVALVAE